MFLNVQVVTQTVTDLSTNATRQRDWFRSDGVLLLQLDVAGTCTMYAFVNRPLDRDDRVGTAEYCNWTFDDESLAPPGTEPYTLLSRTHRAAALFVIKKRIHRKTGRNDTIRLHVYTWARTEYCFRQFRDILVFSLYGLYDCYYYSFRSLRNIYEIWTSRAHEQRTHFAEFRLRDAKERVATNASF